MAHKEVRPIQNLTALVLREDGYWRKKLHRCEMTKAIWHIFPTERQLANPEWLRLNGWRKLSGDTGSAGGEGMSEQTRVQEFAEILGRPLTKSERLELLTSLAASERLDEARYQLNHVKACGTRAEALDWQGKRIAALERTAKGESQ